MSLNPRDRAILDMLQHSADTPVYEIAARVNLSSSACSRRIQQLRDQGYIKRTVALLDRGKLDVPMTVFVIVHARHSDAWLDRFREVLSAIPEIVECHRLAGDFDYLMKVIIPDIGCYDRVYKRLIAEIELADISAYISMETIKESSVLPLR
ncbi:Lrp/AsnC family transcriptional regulator [Stakelama sp. CBK3Z-3]|uniref:Lrp/AsnC family transcriptional regulator n=1 Tax=Stakelama flava TaxID=2860338 RepID=A0ABS6XJ32_9SPHN|nr:Lrp/AsnC family transcriptional regulator [Stakelama flava]MBW4330200.1 Lrp/AsnC family transcriptional regulator [Stakelama flava]